tara:strand:+ start:3488 stop:3994 length:507 start_codon:yes stop_codon:yes gene_type:complete
MQELEDLKSEAAELGIKHNASIGAEKLKEKIEEHYSAQENSGPALQEQVKEKAEKAKKDGKVQTSKAVDTKISKRLLNEKNARKTRIVVIVDNDQRTNAHTTTCVVNCSNEFFDLGTRILPLGEKIEVAQGHINVLKEVYIPLHTRDPKTGLSLTKTRQRYSVSFEEV